MCDEYETRHGPEALYDLIDWLEIYIELTGSKKAKALLPELEKLAEKMTREAIL